MPDGLSIILISGLPTGAELGIDWYTWTCGPAFAGVRGVPAGMHLLHASAGPAGLQSGRLFWVKNDRSLLRYRWCQADERLVASDESTDDYPAVLEPLCAPYPRDTLKSWRDLTSHASELHDQLAWLAGREIDSAGDCPFATPLPPGHPADCPPQDINRYRLDRSWALGDMLRHAGRAQASGNQTDVVGASGLDTQGELAENLLLAELQLAFVLAVTLHCSASLDRWLGLLGHLCRVRDAVASKRRLFVNFLRCLQPQLSALASTEAELPPGGLRPLLIDLWQNCAGAVQEDDNCRNELMPRLDELNELAGRLWGWRLDCEEDENVD